MQLARAYGSGPVLIADIARHEKVPQKFLESILLELRNCGIVESKRGKGGGYSLARPPRSLTVGQVLRHVEGPLAPISCVSQVAYRKCEDCNDERSCAFRIIMKDVRDATSRILDSTTLDDLIKRSELAAGARVLTYAI